MKLRPEKNKGFTITEVMFASVVFAIVIASILGVWMFSYKTWSGEKTRTNLRVNLMKASERLKTDLRLSSMTYMQFYPSGNGPYTAVSLPSAETDDNGLFSFDGTGKIDWDKTVIYHVFTTENGENVLRRTVFDPRDNDMTEAERYAQLAGVVSSGEGGEGSSTDEAFLEDIKTFEISSLAPVIDFYADSDTPQKSDKTVFGWAYLDNGAHTISFEIAGEHPLSLGMDIGIDTIMIEPSGSLRDFEYYNSEYAPPGALTVSGGSVNRVYDMMFHNGNYLEFNAAGEGSYIQMSDSYDLWRESAFDGASLNNVKIDGEERRALLDIPEGTDGGEITWFAYAGAEDSEQSGHDGSLLGGVVPPVSFRTVITKDNIDVEADLVRVSFVASGTSSLIIDRAYITKRDEAAGGANGLANLSTSGLEIEEYHRHQQLFFDDGLGNITAGVTIDPGETAWSVWTGFPLRTGSDYLISLHIADSGSLNCTYWQGSAGTERTYYISSADNTLAGTPDWSGETPTALTDVYITSTIEGWQGPGTIESQIFDTTLASPNYNEMKWSENTTAESTIILKARSSDDEYMTGASDWSVLSGSGVNPHSLSIGDGRYVQFLGELSTDVVWVQGESTLTYDEYIDAQVTSYPVYGFPSTGGEPYVTGNETPWIDDVEIGWDGLSRICAITGYIAKKNDYGQASLTVDGETLVKVLSVHLEVEKETQERMIDEESFVEIEPRNTGR